MWNSFVWPIDRTLSGATNPGQSGHGSNGNEEVLHIPQSSSITGVSPSDCFVSYLGHSLGVSYLSAEMQSVYSIAPADWAVEIHTVSISKVTVIHPTKLSWNGITLHWDMVSVLKHYHQLVALKQYLKI